MSATATCDICSKTESIETTPLGVALMPKHWFVTVRPNGDEMKVVDVCSDTCATAYDMQHGRPDGKAETMLEDVKDGEIVTRTIEHKTN